MGRLFLAVAGEAGLRRVCAIKTLAVEHGDPEAEDLRGRFLDEARVVMQLSNENLAYVFDAGFEAGEPYLAMEYIAGKTLAAVWNRCAERQTPFSLGTSMYVVLEMLSGLAYVHGYQGLGLIHRDISPSNVMISYGGSVKLIDFGVAKWRDRATRTRAGVQWGKNSYKSPEQQLGEQVDQRSDVFSVGVIFWEVLAGRQLFPDGELRPLRADIPPPSVYNEEIPPELDAIVLKATAHGRDARYQSAGLFHMALAKYLRAGDAKMKLGYLMASLFGREIAAHDVETAGLISGVPANGQGGAPVRPVDQTTRDAAADDPLVGVVLGERYEVRRLIGRGAMGVVYECYHRGIGKRVAIKLPNPSERDSETINRFMIEAQAAGRIDHPNVARVTDSGRTPDGAFFIVMDYLDGTTLDHIVHREAPLTWSRACGIAVQIARALGAAHSVGIVHRDLKPSNVMLVRGPSGEEQVRVLDFGLAKVADLDHRSGLREGLTRPGFMLGTPRYMAPEQIASGAAVDHRADLYAIGSILYELLTKHAPFEAQTPEVVCHRKTQEDATPISAWQPDLPDGAAELVMKALARAPADRPQSAAAIEQALVALSPPSVSRRRSTDRVPRQTPRPPVRRALVIGGTAITVVVTTIGVASHWRRGQVPSSTSEPPAFRARPTAEEARMPVVAPRPGVTIVRTVPRATVEPAPAGSLPEPSPPPPVNPTGPEHHSRWVRPERRPRPATKTPARNVAAIAAALDDAEDSYRTGKVVDALRYAQQAFRIGGGIEARLVLGRIYLQMQRYADAEREYVEVLKSDPDSLDAQRGLERALARR